MAPTADATTSVEPARPVATSVLVEDSRNKAHLPAASFIVLAFCMALMAVAFGYAFYRQYILKTPSIKRIRRRRSLVVPINASLKLSGEATPTVGALHTTTAVAAAPSKMLCPPINVFFRIPKTLKTTLLYGAVQPPPKWKTLTLSGGGVETKVEVAAKANSSQCFIPFTAPNSPTKPQPVLSRRRLTFSSTRHHVVYGSDLAARAFEFSMPAGRYFSGAGKHNHIARRPLTIKTVINMMANPKLVPVQGPVTLMKVHQRTRSLPLGAVSSRNVLGSQIARSNTPHSAFGKENIPP